MSRGGYWTVQELWPASTIYIIGGGPTFAAQKEHVLKTLTRIRKKEPNRARVIGCNDAYQLGDLVDVCWFYDWQWFEEHQLKLRKFPGLLITGNDHGKHVTDVLCVRSSARGIAWEPMTVAWNKNTGGSAINLALHLGAKRIVLLGYDMKKVDGKHNWHVNPWHPDNEMLQVDPFAKFLENFYFIKQGLDEHYPDVEVINCTPDSALTLFPYQEFDEVVKLK